MRKANELALAKAGFDVLTAADGEEGLQMARAKLPNLIVLDMLLPKLSGPQLLQELKKESGTAKIPVVVLSSLPQKNEEKLKGEGAAAYIEKSHAGADASATLLIQTIENVLQASGGAAPNRRSATTT